MTQAEHQQIGPSLPGRQSASWQRQRPPENGSSFSVDAEGDVIIVKASDVARTLTVAVSVLGVDGSVVEHGEALPNVFTFDYVFRAGVKNDNVRGSTIVVTVRDRAGNVAVREVVVGKEFQV